jgi:hypothetical protein
VQLLAGAGGGNVENAAILLRFAVAIDAIDPGLWLRLSAPLDWRGATRNSVISPESSGWARPRSSQESILPCRGRCRPAIRERSPPRTPGPWICGWSSTARRNRCWRRGRASAVSLSRAASRAGPSRSCSPPGSGPGSSTGGRGWRGRQRSTQAAPPRRSQICSSQVPDAVGWRRGLSGRGVEARHGSRTSRTRWRRADGLFAEERQAFGEQLRHRPGEQARIVGAGEAVQVVKRKPAPGSAQNAQPGHAVLGIEQGAGQGERVEDFGAGSELFEIDGAEGNLSFAQGLRDGSERICGCGPGRRCGIFFRPALWPLGLLDAISDGCGSGQRFRRSAFLERLLFRMTASGSAVLPGPVCGTNSRCSAKPGPGLDFSSRCGLGGGEGDAAAVGNREYLIETSLSAPTRDGVVRKLARRGTESKRSGSSLGISRPTSCTRGKSSASASRKK